ncbi:hypothetical protein ACH4FA_06350 [Streptomyces sp. NPDC017966]|uniref:hypothetical protein n=1 Tax=Streptomyces sp. NPDC017966 TaxID=3365023 RepID=UPI0037B462DA
MTSDRRADLARAIGEHNDAQQRAREERDREQREAAEQQVKADASLYGTPGWDVLDGRRQARARQFSYDQARGGGTDAA